MDYKDKSIFK